MPKTRIQIGLSGSRVPPEELAYYNSIKKPFSRPQGHWEYFIIKPDSETEWTALKNRLGPYVSFGREWTSESKETEFMSEMSILAKIIKELDQQDVVETTNVTDYSPPSQGGARTELLAKYHRTWDPMDAEAARKAGATQQELQGVAEGSDDQKLGTLAREIEMQVGAHFPDSEGLEAIMPRARKIYGFDRSYPEHMLMDLIDAAAKKHLGSDDFYSYVEDFHAQHASDNPEDEDMYEQGMAEAVWDRPSQSYVPRDGRTFGQTNHPREEHCDSCGAATGHAGEDSNVDDEGNVYCDDCYADKQGVAEGQAPTYSVINIQTGKHVGTFRYRAGFMPSTNAKAMGLKPSPTVPNGHKVDYNSIVSEAEEAADQRVSYRDKKDVLKHLKSELDGHNAEHSKIAALNHYQNQLKHSSDTGTTDDTDQLEEGPMDFLKKVGLATVVIGTLGLPGAIEMHFLNKTPLVQEIKRVANDPKEDPATREQAEKDLKNLSATLGSGRTGPTMVLLNRYKFKNINEPKPKSDSEREQYQETLARKLKRISDQLLG